MYPQGEYETLPNERKVYASSWWKTIAIMGGCMLLSFALLLKAIGSSVHTDRSPSSIPSQLIPSVLPDVTPPPPPPISSPSIMDSSQSALMGSNCEGPYPGYPYCEEKVNTLSSTWNANADVEAKYRSVGVDGSTCSFLTYLNLHGFFCPEAADYNRQPIRGVNLGGWLVLEPWITPTMFQPFVGLNESIEDQWTYCAYLGKEECARRLEVHWDTWLTYADLSDLAAGGINHVRIPFGYWIMGDIKPDEPWVTGDLKYLERAIGWCRGLGIHVLLDLHCAPGSQNGFDNSGRKGPIHFADTVKEANGRVIYPNINRALSVIDAVTAHFTAPQYAGTVVAVELVNEAFITIPIEVVKDYYLQGYEVVKKYGDIAVVIGDSFRFGAWGGFMFPPHYRHVWIDTHIYQVFDMYRLSYSWEQHMEQTCTINKPQVAVSPLSTVVGEWSLATTDCAPWLNGFRTGARYDGSFPGSYPIGSCNGARHPVFTPEYVTFLQEFAEKQMDAYESGSSAGWFFWNFKTENAHEWDYLAGLKMGWLPKNPNQRKYKC